MVERDGVFVTLSNRGLDSRTVRVDVDGVTPASADATALFGDRDPSASATTGNAASFAPVDWPVDADAGSAVVEAPPASVVAVRLDG